MEPASEIHKLRTALGLTQSAASKLFGGGVNAFSRYETGKVKPSRALLVLLRLLHKRPDLLPEAERLARHSANAE